MLIIRVDAGGNVRTDPSRSVRGTSLTYDQLRVLPGAACPSGDGWRRRGFPMLSFHVPVECQPLRCWRPAETSPAGCAGKLGLRRRPSGLCRHAFVDSPSLDGPMGPLSAARHDLRVPDADSETLDIRALGMRSAGDLSGPMPPNSVPQGRMPCRLLLGLSPSRCKLYPRAPCPGAVCLVPMEPSCRRRHVCRSWPFPDDLAVGGRQQRQGHSDGMRRRREIEEAAGMLARGMRWAASSVLSSTGPNCARRPRAGGACGAKSPQIMPVAGRRRYGCGTEAHCALASVAQFGAAPGGFATTLREPPRETPEDGSSNPDPRVEGGQPPRKSAAPLGKHWAAPFAKGNSRSCRFGRGACASGIFNIEVSHLGKANGTLAVPALRDIVPCAARRWATGCNGFETGRTRWSRCLSGSRA